MPDLTREQLFESMNYLRYYAEEYGSPPSATAETLRDHLVDVAWESYCAENPMTDIALAERYGVHAKTIGQWRRRAMRILRNPENQEVFDARSPHWRETRLGRIVLGAKGDNSG